MHTCIYMRPLFMPLLFLTYLIPQAGQAQHYIGKKKDIQQILANIRAFSQHYINADYEKLAAAYTEDGKIFPNNADIIEGRTAIKDRWILPAGQRILQHRVYPAEIRITGKYAYDYGTYDGATFSESTGKTATWKGKYVIVWQKVNGDWKIYLDIWNRMP